MIYLLAYISTIVAANITLAVVGFIPVWPGILAPAGVLWAGVALTCRDLVQEHLGRKWAVAGIVVAGLLSLVMAQQFAVASTAAFLCSEFADFAVYTPIRERGYFLLGVTLSNIVGLALDSVLFLLLAFGSLEFLAGQIVGKVEMTALTVAVLVAVRRQKSVAAS